MSDNANLNTVSIASIQSISTAAEGYMKGQALDLQGQYTRSATRANAKALESSADAAILKGKEDANVLRRKVRKLVGDQRAAGAASGVAIDSGDMAHIQDETTEMGAFDALQIENNAYMQAYGYKSQAVNERGAGELAALGKEGEARGTYVTAGLKAFEPVAKAYGETTRNKTARGKGINL